MIQFLLPLMASLKTGQGQDVPPPRAKKLTRPSRESDNRGLLIALVILALVLGVTR